MSYELTEHRKLSEISQLGARVTVGFRRLPAEQKRSVLERLGTVTADSLRKAVKSLPAKDAKNTK